MVVNHSEPRPRRNKLQNPDVARRGQYTKGALGLWLWMKSGLLGGDKRFDSGVQERDGTMPRR
jgi:hypothetical protein